MQTTDVEWWQTGVIYQIYPRSFMDANGDGVGDLAGVIGKLDYLSDTLGVDAIWLSPFYPSPMADFGYDVSDYCAVNPLFGDLATFDDLVAQAHARGLKVIIDIVPNHTSDQHPWFQESRASRDNPKRDWYVWADPAAAGGPPNNWLSVFGGPAWTLDESTGQYYLHSFLSEQPDLNWRNPAVKAAMFDVYRFWLDRGVDGFRIDVAHYVMKDPELRDNQPNPNAAVEAQLFKDLGEYGNWIHVNDKGHPDVHGVYRELRAILDEYSAQAPRMMVGEIHDFDLEKWAAYYGEPGKREFHQPFNFALIGVPWDAQEVRRRVDMMDAAVPPWGWPNNVLGNHDEHRLASRFGKENARTAAMLLLTLRGTPTLYYGDEIGMTDVEIPPELEQDPWGINMPGLGLGRDPERTPMQWSAEPHAGFSPPATEQTWLPVAADYAAVNVAVELDDPTSILNLYRALLGMRADSAALQLGAYQALDTNTRSCFVYTRQAPGERLIVALNFTDKIQVIDSGQSGQAEVLLSTHLDRGGTVNPERLGLRPREGVILRITSRRYENLG